MTSQHHEAPLTTTQLRRILQANYFTPGRQASRGVHDPITDAQIANADRAWAETFRLAHGQHPSQEARELRELASQTTWGACPVLVLGPPGVGKTAIGEGYANSLGLVANTTIASQNQPEDVGGYAIPDLEGRRMMRLPDTWIDRVNAARDGAVQCFDELTTADESMMAALLRVFSDRAAGDRLLNPRVRLIAFGNRPGEAPNARTLDPAAANRFAHFTFEGSTSDDWVRWLTEELDQDTRVQDPNAVEARVLREWPTAFGAAKSLVASFIKSRPQLLHAMVGGDENTRLRADQPQSSGPWASHRTWEVATRALAGASIHGLTEMETQIWLRGIIGDVADELMVYVKDADMPSISELLETKGKYTCRRTGKLTTWKHDAKRMDRTYAVVTAAAMAIRDSAPSASSDKAATADLRDKADWLFGLLLTVGAKAPDMVVRPAHTLVSSGFTAESPEMARERAADPSKHLWAFADPKGAKSNARRVLEEIVQPLYEQLHGKQPSATT